MMLAWLHKINQRPGMKEFLKDMLQVQVEIIVTHKVVVSIIIIKSNNARKCKKNRKMDWIIITI